MRCSDRSTTRELAKQLLAFEQVETTPGSPDRYAVKRVCDKLRRSLSTLAGAAGFHSTLARALNLAKQECARLEGWEVRPDGSLHVDGNEEAQCGDVVLVAHLIGLLITLIGESLTLRILHDVWLDLPESFAALERIVGQ